LSSVKKATGANIGVKQSKQYEDSPDHNM
jgi:hypothetical protein